MQYGLEFWKSVQTVFMFSTVAEMKSVEVNFSVGIERCACSTCCTK